MCQNDTGAHPHPPALRDRMGKMCIQKKPMIAADLFANRFGVSWSEGWMHNIRSHPAHEPGGLPRQAKPKPFARG